MKEKHEIVSFMIDHKTKKEFKAIYDAVQADVLTPRSNEILIEKGQLKRIIKIALYGIDRFEEDTQRNSGRVA